MNCLGRGRISYKTAKALLDFCPFPLLSQMFTYTNAFYNKDNCVVISTYDYKLFICEKLSTSTYWKQKTVYNNSNLLINKYFMSPKCICTLHSILITIAFVCLWKNQSNWFHCVGHNHICKAPSVSTWLKVLKPRELLLTYKI